MIELKAIGGKGSQENVMSDDKSPPTHKINVTTLKNNGHFNPLMYKIFYNNHKVN